MLRQAFLVLMLFLPTASMAQAPLSTRMLQNEQGADYALQTFLHKLNDFQYHYEVRFRNLQPFEENRVVGINEVRTLGLFFSSQTLDDRILGSNLFGSVLTSTIDPLSQFGVPLPFHPEWFNSPSGNGWDMTWGQENGYGLHNSYGVLGCSIPVPEPAFSQTHTGSTCSNAGFTGWVTLNFLRTFFQSTPDYDGSELSSSLGVHSDARRTYNLVPEPSLLLLLSTGLIAVAMTSVVQIFKRRALTAPALASTPVTPQRPMTL